MQAEATFKETCEKQIQDCHELTTELSSDATVLVVVNGCVLYSIATASEHTSTAAHLRGTGLSSATISKINRAIEALQNELSSLQDSDGVLDSRCSASQIDSDIPVSIMRDSE